MEEFFRLNGQQLALTKQPLQDYAPDEGVLAAQVNTQEKDLAFVPQSGDTVTWITKNSPQGLDIIRHDTAHILAQALKEIWKDNIAIAIGPTIQDGFYYDFLCKKPLSENDFARIEEKMHEIVDKKLPIVRHEWSREKALLFFDEQKEPFKKEIIRDLPQDETLSVYQQGDFFDLCRGPHAPNTQAAGHHFKLLRISGAYWRGNSDNVMLQRIYGTAWLTQNHLDDHLRFIAEAKERDHRQIGERAQLFFTSTIARGSVFWLPDGWFVWRTIEGYIRSQLQDSGYQEIKTPLFFDSQLWEQSGHQEKFSESMYYLQQHDEESLSSLKPMNCPAHIEVFKKYPKTYKDLPLRFSEFGSCCRYEPSGALFGLMRLRNFTQDDAHIFCTQEQVCSEAKAFCALLFRIYKHFGFEDIHVKIATRPDNALGSPEIWEKAENALEEALKSMDIKYSINANEGAFYGPKLEFILQDALKRQWQCGTLQLDYILPKRLGAFYIDQNDKKQTPVLLHRAILGSMERFLAILIEHTKGVLPMWLAPHQVALLTITKDANAYADECHNFLKNAGVRVYKDTRNKPIGFKVRAAIGKRIPYILSVGKSESAEKTVSVKKLGDPKGFSMPFQKALNLLSKGSSLA